MASINKLAIRGVRAFSPDEEEQVINFSFPLTIIVGANGCGKTTIIESLKYAVTGSFPPGVKNGQAFVHDPKSAGQSNVKASIKLRFTNRAGNSMVVIRSMEVTQKKTTLTFKALDGLLRTTHPETGERISMSHKCTELDKQIPTMLGVSKAILEHVVFCHQEESSWPLQEGAVLKKRFDEIFDSTRYAKALKAITDCRKEHATTAKELQIDLASLQAHKQTANQFRLEMEDTVEKLSEVEQLMEECTKGMEAQEVEMKQHQIVLKEVNKLKDLLSEKQSLVERERGIYESRRDMLEQDFTTKHSLEELQKMLKGFEHQQMESAQVLQEKLDEISSIKQTLSKLSHTKSKLLQDQSRLQTLLIQHQRNVEQQNQKIADICQVHSIEFDGEHYSAPTAATAGDDATSVTGMSTFTGLMSMGTQQTTATGFRVAATQDSSGVGAAGAATGNNPVRDYTEDEVAYFVSNLQQTLGGKQQSLQQLKQSHQVLQDKLLKELGDVQAKQSSIDNDIARLRGERKKVEQEMSQLRSQLQQKGHLGGRIRKSDVDDAKAHAERLAKERDDLSNDARLTSIPNEIKQHESQIIKLKQQIDEESELLASLRKNAQEQTSIATLEQEMEHDQERLDDLLRDNSFVFQKYHLSTPTTSAADLSSMEALTQQVSDKKTTMEDDLRDISQRVYEKQRRVTEQRTILGQTQRTLQQTQRRVSQMEHSPNGGVVQIQNVIDDIKQFEVQQGNAAIMSMSTSELDPKTIQTSMRQTLDQLNADGAVENEVVVIQTIKKLKKMSKVKNAEGRVVDLICPCCRRGMDSNDAKEFNTMMDLLADPNRSEMIQSDRQNSQKRQRLEKWLTTLNNHMDEYQEYKRLKDDVNQKLTSIEELQLVLATMEAELDEEQKTESDMKADLIDLTNLFNDTIRFRDDATRISDKKIQIKSRKDRLNVMAPMGGGSRSLREVETSLADKTHQKDDTMNQIAKLNKEMTKLNSTISLISQNASNAEKTYKDKAERYQQTQEASIRKEQLTQQYNDLEDQMKKCEETKNPVRQMVLKKESERDRLRLQQRQEEEKFATKVDSLKHDLHQLQGLVKAVVDFSHDGSHDTETKRVEDSLQKVENDIQTQETLLKEKEPELDECKKQQASKDRQKKILEDNIAMFDSQERLQALEDEVTEVRDELHSIKGYEEASRGYENSVQRRDEFHNERTKCEGRRIGLKEQLKQLKRKLQSEDYRDVDERHRIKMIQHETTKLAVSDLDKYHSALDKALMKFHSIKIADINKIIRELWTLTYKGEDIYNIELVSGQDGPATSGSGRATKSYNYRVAMSKGNTQMDMRGRCSAGQRVLASIVIRLALAETFCLNCGVMALDEPTTNLDFENKKGLAVALAQIIAVRAAQHNFQLVIITHDEEFVSMMKAELSTQAGFDMPERYFQVSREEGQDGKFYSKIHAIDWDEI